MSLFPAINVPNGGPSPTFAAFNWSRHDPARSSMSSIALFDVGINSDYSTGWIPACLPSRDPGSQLLELQRHGRSRQHHQHSRVGLIDEALDEQNPSMDRIHPETLKHLVRLAEPGDRRIVGSPFLQSLNCDAIRPFCTRAPTSRAHHCQWSRSGMSSECF